MSAVRTIVAGVSHLADDDPTLGVAAALARWSGAELHLVHAFDFPPLFASPGLEYASPETSRLYLQGQRERLEAAARRVPGAEAAVCHTIVGGPAPALVQMAAGVGADLLVVGAGHRGRLAGAFLGTTAQRVLRASPVPVLVARRPVHRTLERVLLTSDLSELSAAVHERGMDVVAALFDPPAAVRSLLVTWVPLVPSPLPRDAVDRAALAELVTFLAARPGGGAVEPVVRTGDAAEEIVAEAAEWGADLLVVGTHARGWASRLALGSVAEASLRDAPCNVLAVPPRALAAPKEGGEVQVEAHSSAG
jgi:nucleotide-binding universal stress UspA family protein